MNWKRKLAGLLGAVIAGMVALSLAGCSGEQPTETASRSEAQSDTEAETESVQPKACELCAQAVAEQFDRAETLACLSADEGQYSAIMKSEAYLAALEELRALRDEYDAVFVRVYAFRPEDVLLVFDTDLGAEENIFVTHRLSRQSWENSGYAADRDRIVSEQQLVYMLSVDGKPCYGVGTPWFRDGDTVVYVLVASE